MALAMSGAQVEVEARLRIRASAIVRAVLQRLVPAGAFDVRELGAQQRDEEPREQDVITSDRLVLDPPVVDDVQDGRLLVLVEGLLLGLDGGEKAGVEPLGIERRGGDRAIAHDLRANLVLGGRAGGRL